MKNVADLYISISSRVEKNLMELGISKEKIKYLPNGVNTKLFNPQGEKEDNLILFAGRITWGKGLHVLLKCLHYLKRSVRLVIAGSADWSLGYHQGMLTRIEKENQMGKHKIEYIGALDQQSIIEWYQKASIVVLPSFMEAFPVVILEALSCETPVIATPVGGVPEVIRSGKNGILVPVNNPEKLAEAIQYLLDNEDVRVRLGLEGRKLIKRNFSLDVIAKKLCNIYTNILV